MGKSILWGVIQSPVIITPRYPQGQPHHVTLQFGVDCDDWKQWEGLEFSHICHGGRDLQLKIFTAQGKIKAPTNESLFEVMREVGIEPAHVYED
jgi:hypothetical protein